jgi:hypothetical protein
MTPVEMPTRTPTPTPTPTLTLTLTLMLMLMLTPTRMPMPMPMQMQMQMQMQTPKTRAIPARPTTVHATVVAQWVAGWAWASPLASWRVAAAAKPRRAV